jgi:hypothetical protein
VLHESLWRAWSLQKRAVPISPAMYFSPDGLALGAGTILLPAVGPRHLADLQGEEARLLALLAATYGKAISPSALGSIERAAKSWHEGDDIAAVGHLAHAGLPLPVDPSEEARRLFITDAFIKTGTSPFEILQSLGLDGSYVEAVEKLYNPLEPRVPAGNGIFSGRWTKILSFLGDLTATQAEQLGLWAARLLAPIAPEAAGAVAAAGLLVFPSPNRIRVKDDIKGLPGGRYSWNRDETEIHITYRDADGEQRTFTAQRKEREFLGPRGQVVGRVLPNDTVAIDADALPGRPANDNEPKLCPRPQPDRRTNDKGLEYEAFMRPIVNPFMPTPPALAYYLPKRFTGEAVEFDDCEQKTGTMIDYKDQYWDILTKPGLGQFIVDQLMDRALRQISAAGSRPIRWYFAEEQAADYVRRLLKAYDEGREAIDVQYRPPLNVISGRGQ